MVRRLPLPPSRLRWATLFLCCVVLFGSYYCYDNPAALHDQLRARLVPRAAAPGAFEYEFGLLDLRASVVTWLLLSSGVLFSDCGIPPPVSALETLLSPTDSCVPSPLPAVSC